MRGFGDYNPIAVFVCLMSCAGIAVFTLNPVIIILSVIGAAGLWFVRMGTDNMKSHLLGAAMLVVLPLLNMLVSHKGATVFIVINDNPVTLESLVYGVFSTMMLVSVLYWFRSFSQIMTSDKILYLLGRVSPKLALVLSMTLRFIPHFSRQAKKIDNAQKVMGLYKEDNIVDSAKGKLRVFSVLVTWGLENGITTADSMTARGYGTVRRTSFSIFRFGRSDALLTAVTLLLLGGCVAGMAFGGAEFSYYPKMTGIPRDISSLIVYICYGIMTLLPTVIETEVKLRWHSLKSAI